MLNKKIIVIGAGIGGLAAALKLAHNGLDVTVIEQHSYAGGKIRSMASSEGPVDAGPTVFTLKNLFDSFFSGIGEDLNQHLELSAEPLIANHFWPDDSSLKLYSHYEKNIEAIRQFSGPKSAKEYEKFTNLTSELFNAFKAPIILSPNPSIINLIKNTFLKANKLLPALLPWLTLSRLCKSQFSDPRLQQLFSRYATYVGGSPYDSPAILSLIWQAESNGIWRIKGGMNQLPKVMQSLGKARGVEFRFNEKIEEIMKTNQRVSGVRLKGGETILSDVVIYNGDPKAILNGLLGKKISNSITRKNVFPRSLSAYVWSFSASTENNNLCHHNVFFNNKYESEFIDIANNRMPINPALYVCAQDRGSDMSLKNIERFEIIMNAGPIKQPQKKFREEYNLCKEITFRSLKEMNLEFNPIPQIENLTTPTMFNQMFPGSNGSLYGLNPNRMMATFKRAKLKSMIQGLYLVGGGVHPGPGVPMAMLSGQHAAETILRDHFLI